MGLKQFYGLFILIAILVSNGISVNFPNPQINEVKNKARFGPKYDIFYSGSGGGTTADNYFGDFHGNANQQERSFIFPEGTMFKLTLTPELTVPYHSMTDLGLFKLDSKFQATFPFSLIFGEKKEKMMPSMMSMITGGYKRNDQVSKKRFWKSKLAKFKTPFNYTVRHNHNNKIPFYQHSHTRLPRGLFIAPKSKCLIRSLADRMAVIEKVELTGLRMLGFASSINPKDCLLRAVCELHEGPIGNEMGLLGEIATVAFTFAEISSKCANELNYSSLLKSLQPYVDAEIAGKSKTCTNYYKKCSKSIFSNAY